jgi:hypothetical protein
MLLIGSRALNHHFPEHSKPNDWDYIATEEEVISWANQNNATLDRKVLGNLTLYGTKLDGVFYEFEIAENNNSACDYLNIIPSGIASIEILFSIKKSHIVFPINFEKHIKEYHFLKNIVKVDVLSDITKKRHDETYTRLNYKLPNLNQTVKEFVTESQKVVKRVFDHDDIHKKVAYGSSPAYFKIQPDITKVWCSKKMWDVLYEVEKIEMVLEEAYVIAIERKLVPMLFQEGKHWRTIDAVKWAIMRICTTLASGYFREFAVENYFKIIESIDLKFMEKFLNSVDNKEVKLYTEDV